jgi:hypothetical protein
MATELNSVTSVQEALRACASDDRARVSQTFFKTGPGMYGAGDRFLGVTVPEQRAIAKEQQRKVLRVECDLDLKRIAKIEMWLNVIFNDKRRTW